jgi:peptide-methionine (S)-S-oxide reductase
MELTKTAFGGGCHWCTEAVFQSLIGVAKVEQGWVASTAKNNTFSEAVIVYFDDNKIDLKTLIDIHLATIKAQVIILLESNIVLQFIMLMRIDKKKVKK